MDTLLEQATPRTQAGRQLLDLLESDSARPFLRSVMATNIADVEAEAVNAYEPLVKALRPIRGLRITGDQIRAALKALGPTGDRAEAYIKVAATAAADALDALATVESSPEREGGE